jgi:hypothetical protein
MDSEIRKQLIPLVNRYRERCLWFLKEDYVPNTPGEASIVLDFIERYGDREAFTETRRLKKWLSLNFRETSAG